MTCQTDIVWLHVRDNEKESDLSSLNRLPKPLGYVATCAAALALSLAAFACGHGEETHTTKLMSAASTVSGCALAVVGFRVLSFRDDRNVGDRSDT